MSQHILKFKDTDNCPIYNLIKNRLKLVEGRKNSKIYQNINIGDILLLDDIKGILYCRVIYIHKYADIREYLEKETIDRALPCVSNIDNAIEVYNKFVSNEEIEQLRKDFGYGFLGIGINYIMEQPKHHIHVSQPWFSLIKENKKTVEGRLNKGQFSQIMSNDIVVFFNKKLNKRTCKRVVEIKNYDTFEEMIVDSGLENIFI